MLARAAANWSSTLAATCTRQSTAQHRQSTAQYILIEAQLSRYIVAVVLAHAAASWSSTLAATFAMQHGQSIAQHGMIKAH
jgi:hypothetical protein